jgi:hypothetical protein
MITGTFCAGWMGKQDAGWWERELKDMKALGFDVIIFQHATFGERTFYEPATIGLPAPDGDTMGALLAAAEKAGGFEIHLGLGFPENWGYSGATTLEQYRELEKFNEKVADDLYRNYSRFKCFRGWYIPQEVDSTRSWEPASAAPDTPMGRLLDGYYRPLMKYLKDKDSGKPVSIAPFFGEDAMSPAVFREWYALLLESCPLDILMMQDGIGVFHGYLDPVPAGNKTVAPPCSALEYLAATRDACKRARKSFWLDLEVFRLAGEESTPGSMESMVFEGFPFPGIREQVERQAPLIAASGPYGDRIVVYEYFTNMSLNGSNNQPEAGKLYEAYREYLARTHRPRK